MKKILSLVLSLMFVGCFALDWNTTTDEGIKEWKDKGDGYSLIGYGLDSVRNMNGDTPYETVKKTYNDAVTKANETVKYKNFKKDQGVPKLVLNCKRFNGLAKDILKDADYNNTSIVTLYYVRYLPDYFTKQQIRTYCIKNVETKNIIYCKIALETYQINFNKFTDAQIKEDLRKMKRVIYPMIGTNDEWKQLAVKLELMLKSVE